MKNSKTEDQQVKPPTQMNRNLANQMKVLSMGLKSQNKRGSTPKASTPLLMTPKKTVDIQSKMADYTDEKRTPELTPSIPKDQTPLKTPTPTPPKAYLPTTSPYKRLPTTQASAKPLTNQQPKSNNSPEAKSVTSDLNPLSQTVKKLRFSAEKSNKVATRQFGDSLQNFFKKKLLQNFAHLKTESKTRPKIVEAKIFEAKNSQYGKITTGPQSSKTVQEIHVIKTPETLRLTEVLVEKNARGRLEKSDEKKTAARPEALEKSHRRGVSDANKPLMLGLHQSNLTNADE
jgi:hypothetical protein